MTFDPTKPVQTRDGRKARIVCTDRKGTPNLKIVALVDENTGEHPYIYYKGGEFLQTSHESVHDLVNIPERVSRWINIYNGRDVGNRFLTREHADDIAGAYSIGRIAVLELIFEGDRLVETKIHEVTK